MKKIALLVVALAVGASLLTAQEFVSDVSKKGTTAATFLSIGQGARASAMGSAFVAVADDPSSIYWNPAGLASVDGYGFVFDHTRWIADIQYNFIGATIGIGRIGVLGLSLTASNVGDMRVTTITEPNGTGETFGVSDVAFSLAYAVRLTDAFSIGFNPKFVYQKIWKMSASALAIDVGVKYETPFKGITLGMAISNFGGKMQMTGNSALVLYDPDLESTGNNGRIPAELQTDEWALPLNFRFGIAYQPVISAEHKIVLAVDALHPGDNYESVNVGAEYTFNDFISFRGGFKSLFLKDAEETFALGIGLRQNLMGNIAIRIDYAYSDFGRLKNIQKFTVGMTF